MALQLSNAINLIIICYEDNIKEPLSTIKYETDKYYYSEPYDRKIKAVNTIIGNLFDKKLVEKISEINVNQKIRKFIVQFKMNQTAVLRRCSKLPFSF